MPDTNDQDYESVVLDRRNQAVGTDSVAPEIFGLASECFADPTRILYSGNPLAQETEDPIPVLWV